MMTDNIIFLTFPPLDNICWGSRKILKDPVSAMFINKKGENPFLSPSLTNLWVFNSIKYPELF